MPKHFEDLSFLPDDRLEGELKMWNSIRDQAQTEAGREHAAEVAAEYQAEADTRESRQQSA